MDWSRFDNFEIKRSHAGMGGDFYTAYVGPLPETNQEGFAISIYKWRFIASQPEGSWVTDGGTTSCGLCMVNRYSCRTCPIGRAGYLGCIGTPYEDYRPHTRRAARDEVAFLEDLWMKTYPDDLLPVSPITKE